MSFPELTRARPATFRRGAAQSGWLLLIVLWLAAPAGVAQNQRGLPLPPGLIAFDAPEGQTMLLRSPYKAAFWTLQRWFETQDAPAYCGIATSVMVLNALNIPAPEPAQPRPPGVFTQQNFFTPEVSRTVTDEQVSRRGITLDTLAAALRAFPVKVSAIHARPGGLYAFIDAARRALGTPGGYLVVNYLRSALGQQTYGHYSPVAAYDKVRDRLLILDVARYKYPPVWVRAEDLFAAMQTYDRDAGATRGYLTITARR